MGNETSREGGASQCDDRHGTRHLRKEERKSLDNICVTGGGREGRVFERKSAGISRFGLEILTVRICLALADSEACIEHEHALLGPALQVSMRWSLEGYEWILFQLLVHVLEAWGHLPSITLFVKSHALGGTFLS